MGAKLTDNAIVKIKEILAQQEMSPDTTMVRVGVRGRSCSGPVYSFNLDEDYDTSLDELVHQDGLKLVYSKEFVDDLTYIEVDYKETDDKRGFVFEDKNPLKMLGSCGSCNGCGA